MWYSLCLCSSSPDQTVHLCSTSQIIGTQVLHSFKTHCHWTYYMKTYIYFSSYFQLDQCSKVLDWRISSWKHRNTFDTKTRWTHLLGCISTWSLFLHCLPCCYFWLRLHRRWQWQLLQLHLNTHTKIIIIISFNLIKKVSAFYHFLVATEIAQLIGVFTSLVLFASNVCMNELL